MWFKIPFPASKIKKKNLQDLKDKISTLIAYRYLCFKMVLK
jgi:hypothetical protein